MTSRKTIDLNNYICRTASRFAEKYSTEKIAYKLAIINVSLNTIEIYPPPLWTQIEKRIPR